MNWKETKSNVLPPNNRPHEIIRAAIADLEAVEEMEDVSINMGLWLQRDYSNGLCEVCLAGAVILNRCDIGDAYSVTPSDFHSWDLTTKLRSLDYFRTGKVEDGLISLGARHIFLSTEDRYITPYISDSAAFKKDMLELADELEKEFTAAQTNQRLTS